VDSSIITIQMIIEITKYVICEEHSFAQVINFKKNIKLNYGKYRSLFMTNRQSNLN